MHHPWILSPLPPNIHGFSTFSCRAQRFVWMFLIGILLRSRDHGHVSGLASRICILWGLILCKIGDANCCHKMYDYTNSWSIFWQRLLIFMTDEWLTSDWTTHKLWPGIGPFVQIPFFVLFFPLFICLFIHWSEFCYCFSSKPYLWWKWQVEPLIKMCF